MRRIPREKALEIIRRRLNGEHVPTICQALNLPKSTVYNYLELSQEVADKAFIDELEGEFMKYHAIYCDGKEAYVQISEHERRLAQLLRRYSFLPGELFAKTILEAHWRRLKAWRRRKD
jgi:hypothetical protein